jgi:hypothetical protein
MHDDLVAAINEMLGNSQQWKDVTRHGCGGDEKACHDVSSLYVNQH